MIMPPQSCEVNSHSLKSISEINPSPENDKLYRAVLHDDPATVELAESIEKHGVLEPLVITLDGYIISGHRRYAAAKVAGLTMVPVRVEPIYRSDDIDSFVVKLREYNRQREKTRSEKLREEIVTVDAATAYESLIEAREKKSRVIGTKLKLGKKRKRASFRAEKHEFREAIVSLIYRYQHHWPLTDRRVHYYLLNDPPWRNTRLKLRYENNVDSYKDLTDALTRLRLDGSIPFQCIEDGTRPIESWDFHQNISGFTKYHLENLFDGYWRDLMQSQPNHVEIICEKNTVWTSMRRVASKYCIPVTSGRGHASLDPRGKMFERYEKSGKDKLIIIVVSDFDPSGECIAESFCRSMRDDFGVNNIHPVKAALTHEQVTTLDMPDNGMDAKKTDRQAKAFHKKYGDDQKCYELEALQPETLESLVTDCIDSVIDVDAFNAELEQEKEDAAFLENVRRAAMPTLTSLLESFGD